MVSHFCQTGQGGSYSLAWNQWGHTLYDYVHADKRMTEPQKTLRSLGIIKGNGITFISSASMRMAGGEEARMTSDDLEEFVEAGGFKFLPQSWQGDFGAESEINDWHAWLYGTVKKTGKELRRINIMVIGVYLILILIWDLIRRCFTQRQRSRQHGSLFLRGVFRIVITHGLVILVAWWACRTVDDSNWGKTIRSQKAYRIPVNQDETVNHPPSTIPYRDDILFVRHYESDYLAAYSRIVDFAHPGNKYWKEEIHKFAPGYSTLSSDLQEEFCNSLIEWTTVKRRFLKQDADRFWFKVSDGNELIQFCHRELSMSFDPLLDALLRQLDALENDSKFGLFRNSSMHEKNVPGYLVDWEKKLLPPLKVESTISNNFTTTTTTKKTRAFPLFGTKSLPALPQKKQKVFKRYPIPPQPVPAPPTPYAWLQEGDRVKARYNCNKNGKDRRRQNCQDSFSAFYCRFVLTLVSSFSRVKISGEWFSGTIVTAVPNEAGYDIDYDDGDEENNLKQHCVLPMDYESSKPSLNIVDQRVPRSV
jgi:hypothetical protein